MFNGPLQQVLLRRTGRPVVGWTGTGWEERIGEGRGFGRESVGAGQVTVTGSKLPRGKALTSVKHPSLDWPATSCCCVLGAPGRAAPWPWLSDASRSPPIMRRTSRPCRGGRRRLPAETSTVAGKIRYPASVLKPAPFSRTRLDSSVILPVGCRAANEATRNPDLPIVSSKDKERIGISTRVVNGECVGDILSDGLEGIGKQPKLVL
jgi:hypothetical protein